MKKILSQECSYAFPMDKERQMLADAITAGIIRSGGDIAQYAFCIRKKIPFEPQEEEDDEEEEEKKKK